MSGLLPSQQQTGLIPAAYTAVVLGCANTTKAVHPAEDPEIHGEHANACRDCQWANSQRRWLSGDGCGVLRNLVVLLACTPGADSMAAAAAAAWKYCRWWMFGAHLLESRLRRVFRRCTRFFRLNYTSHAKQSTPTSDMSSIPTVHHLDISRQIDP